MFSKEESSQLRELFWISFGKSFPRKWMLYNTQIKGFNFKFVANHKQAMVCLDIESYDKGKNELLFVQLLELKNIIVEEYVPAVIFDANYMLDSGKEIHRVYVKLEEKFNIHNKNTWKNAYDFFNKNMSQFEQFYEDFEDFIKQVIY